jgi:hypothetical protein
VASGTTLLNYATLIAPYPGELVATAQGKYEDFINDNIDEAHDVSRTDQATVQASFTEK